MHKPTLVTVKRISVAGLIVSLPDGKEGFIRERELGTNRKGKPNRLSSFKPDDQVEAVMIGKMYKGRLELSVSLVNYDKWITNHKKLFGQSVMEGEVTGLMSYGVFVDLAPGVTGLVHTSKLPKWSGKRLTELFWPGDRVKVIVEDANPSERRLHLRMTEIPRWSEAELAQKASSISLSQQSDVVQPATLFDELLVQPPLSILVVEDDPWQQQSLTTWLHSAGQIAEGVGSAEEALDRFPVLRPDLVLVDLGLPGINGIEGVERLLAIRHGTRFAIMTDWSTAEQHTKELLRLRKNNVDLLIKPLLPIDLLETLLQTSPDSLSDYDGSSPLQFTASRTPPGQDSEDDGLRNALIHLLQNTQADKVVIFEVDADSRQIHVLEQKGAARLYSGALPQLIHSPVRDVAEERKRIVARSLRDLEHKRFLHLKPLLDFESCIGEPVPARLHNRYALFLFFTQPLGLTEELGTRIESTSAIVGLWLERRHLIRQSADLHRTALLGQLNRTMVHEISGRLSPINLILEELQIECNQAEGSARNDPAKAIEVLANAHQVLRVLSEQAKALTKTMRSFSRMTRPGQEEIVVLSEIIEDAVTMLQDSSNNALVTIETRPAPRLFFTRAQVTSLQQIVVNVLQNAIQQIHLLRPQLGGHITIAIAQHADNEQQKLRITIEDDGPGIHRRLWERIFEMDYTTRAEGSGLGLYISRRLIEAQGGRIWVQASYILWGTIIAIELPYRM